MPIKTTATHKMTSIISVLCVRIYVLSDCTFGTAFLCLTRPQNRPFSACCILHRNYIEYNPHKAYHICDVIYISFLSRDLYSVTVEVETGGMVGYTCGVNNIH